jgi:hypothetical protein
VPVSAVPVSDVPVSDVPVSDVPVSAVPVTTLWNKTEQKMFSVVSCFIFKLQITTESNNFYVYMNYFKYSNIEIPNNTSH